MAKSARVFAGVREPRGRDFCELTSLFTAMLFQANIPRGKQWVARARLWQLILLQHDDGHWQPSSSLAFALQAHRHDSAQVGDACPLTCEVGEIEATLPEALEAAGGRPAAVTIWATALAVATLERFKFCWSSGSEEEGSDSDGSGSSAGSGEEELPRTIVDAANEWLHRQHVRSSRHPTSHAHSTLTDRAAARPCPCTDPLAVHLARSGTPVGGGGSGGRQPLGHGPLRGAGVLARRRRRG